MVVGPSGRRDANTRMHANLLIRYGRVATGLGIRRFACISRLASRRCPQAANSLPYLIRRIRKTKNTPL